MSLVSRIVRYEGAMDGEGRKDEYGVAYANGWVESGMGWDSRSDMEVGGRYWNGKADRRVEGRNGLVKPTAVRREIWCWGSRSSSVREGCGSRSAGGREDER
jgi:hypothetical protein